MKELVIGDMHFGIKSNSTEWLESQCRFIETQIFDVINKYELDRIVFLGDLSDIRYSINQQVGVELKRVIGNLCDKLKQKNPNGYIVILAGNHDYYSPIEEMAKYNAYKVLFGEEYIKIHSNLIIVDNVPLLKDDSLFLPWYWTDNPEHFDELLYRYDFGEEVKGVYCHADLSIWPGPRIASLKGTPVFAGHIHYIMEDPVCNLYNIGAALQLTFGDCNQDRYLYIIDDFKIVDRIANDTTPKFIRLINDDIFKNHEDIYKNSNNIQLCISKSNIEKANYTDRIKYLKMNFTDVNFRINVIDDEDIKEPGLVGCSFNTNISEYIETNIPKKLNLKFNKLKEKINNL